MTQLLHDSNPEKNVATGPVAMSPLPAGETLPARETLPSDHSRGAPAPARAVSPRPATRPGLRFRQRVRRDWVLLLFVLPGTALLLVFHYIPLLGNVTAFQNYLPFLGFGGSEWVGFGNFSILFNGDPAFLNALKNTVLLIVIQTVFVFPIPIVLALTLNSLLSGRLRTLVQSILLLPHFLSWVIVVALFQQILGGSGRSTT